MGCIGGWVLGYEPSMLPQAWFYTRVIRTVNPLTTFFLKLHFVPQGLLIIHSADVDVVDAKPGLMNPWLINSKIVPPN